VGRGHAGLEGVARGGGARRGRYGCETLTRRQGSLDVNPCAVYCPSVT
jgi:hypothetical protein